LDIAADYRNLRPVTAEPCIFCPPAPKTWPAKTRESIWGGMVLFAFAVAAALIAADLLAIKAR
jgi:hypothetical protein